MAGSPPSRLPPGLSITIHSEGAGEEDTIRKIEDLDLNAPSHLPPPACLSGRRVTDPQDPTAETKNLPLTPLTLAQLRTRQSPVNKATEALELAERVFPLMGMFPTGDVDVLRRPVSERRPAGDTKWYIVGTCFSISSRELLTARHVVRGEGHLSVVIEGKRHEVSVRWDDPRTNLCCLELPPHAELSVSPLLPRAAVDKAEPECLIPHYPVPETAPRVHYVGPKPGMVKSRVDCDITALPAFPVLEDAFLITVSETAIFGNSTVPTSAAGAPVLYRQFQRMRLRGLHCCECHDSEPAQAGSQRMIINTLISPIFQRLLMPEKRFYPLNTPVNELLFDPGSDDERG